MRASLAPVGCVTFSQRGLKTLDGGSAMPLTVDCCLRGVLHGDLSGEAHRRGCACPSCLYPLHEPVASCGGDTG